MKCCHWYWLFRNTHMPRTLLPASWKKNRWHHWRFEWNFFNQDRNARLCTHAYSSPWIWTRKTFKWPAEQRKGEQGAQLPQKTHTNLFNDILKNSFNRSQLSHTSETLFVLTLSKMFFACLPSTSNFLKELRALIKHDIICPLLL